ncbi:MAG: hypothetical protein EA379_07485 [Phycisphaerales bacterium]|nr:MAG: hypothetical protein EA379_07485 [Phycisphaerales bacterium]
MASIAQRSASCSVVPSEASAADSPSSSRTPPVSGSSASPSNIYAPRVVQSRRTTMRFCVSVPVLSDAITVQLPSVSTAGNRRITAFCFAIRRTLTASATVITMGRPSGMAATAMATAVRNISGAGTPSRTPMVNATAQIATTATLMNFPKRPIRACSGVCARTVWCTSVAMRPICAADPVATTTARMRPVTTVEPMNTRLRASVTRLALSTPACLGTGTDSPVSSASSACACVASSTRASAGTLSPDSSSTTSPGTRSALGISRRSPSRRTTALGATRSCSACIARSARRSWKNPIEALMVSTAAITIASVK